MTGNPGSGAIPAAIVTAILACVLVALIAWTTGIFSGAATVKLSSVTTSIPPPSTTSASALPPSTTSTTAAPASAGRVPGSSHADSPPIHASGRLSIRVAGNILVDASGHVVQLRGVNRSGTEYACIQGWGVFDGPSDAASVAAIASWHANVVRIPINEDCWLGINGVNPEYGGSNYRQAIVNYVSLLNQHGLYAILELHWSAPGTTKATGQQPMPDQAHGPTLWTSVADTFRDNPAVIFDLFNEPYPDNNTGTEAAWVCWQTGRDCNVPYQVAGMQELVNSVRATGATNVLMLGGIQYAGNLGLWTTYAPTDPDHQLAASLHDYSFGICHDVTCWDSSLSSVGKVPLITGEIGENDGSAAYIEGYMDWADKHAVSYLAWTWDSWGCGNTTVLIENYTGTPCPSYGSGFRQHLAR